MSESHDPLAFTPVPSASRRHDGWTPQKQRAFIAQLASIGIVSASAREVGMSPKSAYALLERASEESGFARAWKAAVEQGRARARHIAIARSIHGTATPVFYRGRQIGERRRYNDRLIIAALRLSMPDRHGPPPPEPWDG